MKKLAVVLLAMVFALGMAFTAQATNQVNVKTNSEPITKVGCEKNGSIQFTFDTGSEITAGDWWIIDLPLGATLCQPIDFVLNGGTPTTPLGAAITALDDGNAYTFGPYKIKDLVAGDAITGALVPAAWGGIYLRVVGAVGSQRITVTAGNPASGDWDNGPGSGSITVGAGAEFTVVLFDQQVWAGGAWACEDVDNGTAGAPRDNIYGNDFGSGEDLEIVDNTLCVNAQNMSGNYVNVSLDSKDDKFNFTGDNEVAHVMAADVITLTACKGATTGNVAIGSQGSCSFDYDSPAGSPPVAPGYCTGQGFVGNRMIISNNNNWDDADYALQYKIISPAAGVYWNAVPGAGPLLFTSAQDGCSGGAASTLCGAWSLYKADGVTTALPATSSCSIPASQQGTVLVLDKFGKSCGNLLNTYNKFFVDLPPIVYDSSVVTNGTQVIVQVDLMKVPCGVIFTGTRTVATIVSSCAAAAPTIDPIVLPYFTNPSSQWWAGFAVVNNSDAAGTVNITMYEEDGDVATLNGVALPARGTDGCMGVWLTSELVTLVTPDAGNAGQIGDARFWLNLQPSVSGMRAFVMMGDGSQGMGYIDGN